VSIQSSEQIVVVETPVQELIEGTTEQTILQNQEQVIDLTIEDRTVVFEHSDVGAPGPIGPQGPEGPIGPPGPGDAAYIHSQLAPSATWTIDHNLHKYPSVTVVDSAGTTVEGEVSYPSIDRVVIQFTATFGGSAYLN
jgi:hypothetical protein